MVYDLSSLDRFCQGVILMKKKISIIGVPMDSGKIISMDLVEINPILDIANKTAELAVELTLSALGKSIL